MRSSAWKSRTQGTAISTSAYASTHRHCARIPSRSPWRKAKGAIRRAAGAVRKKTSAGAESSSTAMRMNRYGMPQMMHRAMKSTQPLRVTGRPP